MKYYYVTFRMQTKDRHGYVSKLIRSDDFALNLAEITYNEENTIRAELELKEDDMLVLCIIFKEEISKRHYDEFFYRKNIKEEEAKQRKKIIEKIKQDKETKKKK